MCSSGRRRWMWLFTIRLYFETTKVPSSFSHWTELKGLWLAEIKYFQKISNESTAFLCQKMGGICLSIQCEQNGFQNLWRISTRNQGSTNFRRPGHNSPGRDGFPEQVRGSLKGTKSLESYWESIWNAQWDKVPNENCAKGCEFDAKMTIYHSWLRQDRVQRTVLSTTVSWTVLITL